MRGENDSDATRTQPKDLRSTPKNTDSNSITPDLPKANKMENGNVKNKDILPSFNNAKDEAELEQMMGDGGEKLLALVDDIRKIDSLRNEELHIPQIVVIGETSTGKSSVLQAFTRLPFPVSLELCTRFVTETTVRQCGPSERPGYKIEVKLDGPSTAQDPQFLPKIFESDDWAEVFQKLREDINDAFDEMSPAHLLPPGVPQKPNHGNRLTGQKPPKIPQLLKHRMEITVRTRHQAHFSVVDIPGIVSNGAELDIKLSTDLARQYIKNKEAIVLAINPANNVMANQKWVNLVMEEKAQDRTIGVITKSDTLDEEDYEPIFDLLRNRAGSEYHLKLGWFAVRNRSSLEIRHKESFEERNMKENEFFGSKKWTEATMNFPAGSSIDPKVLGTQRLKHALQGHLYRRVKENLPRLRDKMISLEHGYSTRFHSMGEPRIEPQDQRLYLSDIQTAYEAEVERSLNGDYRFLNDPKHPSRLRYHVKTYNDEFESAIQLDAIKYQWQMNDKDDTSEELGILTWINNTWENHRGSEPRYDAPRSLKKELVRQQTESWESKTEAYIKRIENAIKACNDDLFMFICKDDDLRFKIREKLKARETQAFEDARTELKKILKDRDYIDSWSPLLELFMGQSQRPRVERQLQLQLAQQKKKTESGEGSLEASLEQVEARQQFYANNKRVYEVHDWLFAYWKVSYPRFVDNVIIQVVERHLLGPNGPLRLFDRKWNLCLTNEELEELVGETEETRFARQELKERLDGLRNALEKVDTALRSRIN